MCLGGSRSMAKRQKYNAVKTTVDGITFASKAEVRRYSELKLLEKAGEITALCLQPPFPIVVNDIPICKYVADFIYWDVEKDAQIIEDVKGMKTPVYKLKKRLVEALYGITITEIGGK